MVGERFRRDLGGAFERWQRHPAVPDAVICRSLRQLLRQPSYPTPSAASSPGTVGSRERGLLVLVLGEQRLEAGVVAQGIPGGIDSEPWNGGI